MKAKLFEEVSKNRRLVQICRLSAMSAVPYNEDCRWVALEKGAVGIVMLSAFILFVYEGWF